VACLISGPAFDAGHNPAAISYQSTSFSLGQEIPLGDGLEIIIAAVRLTSCLYRETLLRQSAHEST
jgi:hypothetical protein